MTMGRSDVANYNALSAVTPDPITQGNPNYDELHYINVSVPCNSENMALLTK